MTTGSLPGSTRPAKLFSDAGYATAAYGKWHVGDVEGRLPTNQGFDEWYGIKNSSDEWGYSSHPLFAESGHPVPKIWEAVKGSPAKPVADLNRETRQVLDEQIATRAAAFIKKNAKAGKPFYAHVCFTHVHPPFIHHPDFKGKSGGGVISDILAELDYRTGQVLDAIDEAGISENTIVVWSSDNPTAPATFGSNGPWRGNFASGFEGGMRAPAMVRWPGKVKAGVVTDEILSAVDWLPTLASLIGESGRVPTDRPIDGIDASVFLLGKSPTTGRDHILYFGSDAGLMSVKWRTMKVVFRYSETFSGPIIKPQIPLMFDLVDDPGEQREIFMSRMDCGWVLMPVLERVGAFQKSVARYPNIKPGDDFTGYR